MDKAFLRISLPYFIAIAIDAIGFTIIGPVLVPLVNHLVNQSSLAQYLSYGFILSLYSFSFMIGAPLLGALSDLVGRRKVLIIASIGVLIGYLSYALSLNTHSLWLLMLGRILTGFCAASQCIAQAAMIDLSKSNNRVNNIGLIASAMTAGLVVGPLASLALGSESLNLNAFKIPFYCIITILILNLFYLIFFLQESFQPSAISHEIKLIKLQISQFVQQFLHKQRRTLFISFFLFELGWSLYYQSLAIELATHLKLNPHRMAIFFSFIGISLTIALLTLVRVVARRITLLYSCRYALVIGFISLISQFFLKSLGFYYLLTIFITSAVALAYTGLVAQLSQQTDTKNQGLLMGSSDALLALAFSITGLLAGYLSFLTTGLPLLVAALFWLSAYLVLVGRTT